ncbi:CaiB/BaiF CoA transferase family protein [Thermodesulfobacteriota bacterium]
MERKQRFLEGIRALEFSDVMAGPMVGKLLADHGAQVIKIENKAHASGRNPGAGATSLTSLNQGYYFNKFCTNKLSLTLDLSNPKAKEICHSLAAISDVVFDNFAPSLMERWDLHYEELVKIKPDIIVAKMPTMGSGGPYSHWRSLSWPTMAMGGLNYMSGVPGRMPICPTNNSLPDSSSSCFHTMVAILAALRYKTRTGKGQFIEVPQLEAFTCFTETGIFDYLVNGREPKQARNRVSYAVPHNVYRCQGDDRWCAIAAFTEEEWKSLCHVIGRDDLIESSKFSTIISRVKNEDELDSIIGEWTKDKSPWAVMELMQQAAVPAGVLETIAEMMIEDPQLKAREHWVKVEHPEAGSMTLEEWGFRLSAMPKRNYRYAPLYGEHNNFVLGEILGLTEDEINKLVVEGVVA